MWQESLASTDVSEMDTDQEEFQSPNSYSASSNNLSLSSLEISPVIRNKYKKKQDCHSDSSGCGMSSTRASKENTLVSGINMAVDHNKLFCSSLDYDFEINKPSSSTAVKSIEYKSCSTKISNKQDDGSKKHRLSKKHKKTVIYYYVDNFLNLFILGTCLFLNVNK